MSDAQDLPDMDNGPALRTIAMPADTNANGDIFGGWLMARMDLAAATVAIRRAQGRVATVAVKEMEFHQPVRVGDEVSCFAHLVKTGNTSIWVKVETYVRRRWGNEIPFKVTEGTFVFVALDENGNKRPVPAEN